ncbi:MAG: hypothetical protein IT374_20920 [Polyangiaceae bacterium]|nr:hypothetical protein [Polyangiaceae bacterium]
MTEEAPLLKRTLMFTGAMLGATILWVGVVSTASLLIVSRALPSADETPATSPATPPAKPASSTPARPPEDRPEKKRNG